MVGMMVAPMVEQRADSMVVKRVEKMDVRSVDLKAGWKAD